MNIRRTGFVLIATLAACSPDAPPSPAAVTTAKAPPAPPPMPDLADLKFRDWSEVAPEQHLEITRPPGAETLSWRFEEARRFGYDYGETLTQKIHRTLGERSEEHVSREKNRGTFEFIGAKDHTALCRVKIQTSELFVDGQVAPRPPHEENPESASEAVVEPDGTPDLKKAGGRADARFYLLTLLALRPGERPLQHGQVRTKIAGARKVERWDCVRIESEFESNVDGARLRQTFKGRAVGYFCPAEGRFIRASAVVATSSRRLELTKDGAAWVVTRLDAVSQSRVTLLE